MENIMLTIYVPTFNHEKYIAKALDSILMQKTKYSFEVLIGEDCSEDNTKGILENYEKMYPGVFTVFYRKSNMYESKPNNTDDLKLRAKGKYIICLEGDDYWIDDKKIEKQITVLEEHPEYLAVCHKCLMVDKFGNPLNIHFPDCQDEEYSLNHFFKNRMPGQTTTFMVRNYVKESIFDTSLIFESKGPGDRRLFFSTICSGRIYCMNDVMSAYRHVTNEGSSFSAKYNDYNFALLEKIAKDYLEYAKKNANKKTIKYMEMFYLKEIFKGVKTKSISIMNSLVFLRILKYPVSDFFLLMKQKIIERG